LPPVSAV